MNKETHNIKEQINELDEFEQIYLLGYLQGKLSEIKGFGDE